MHLKVSNAVGRRANRARPITVNFPIPRRSISKLRALAIERDPRLVDMGVLAVQISDDESIVLGIELEKAKRKDSSISTNISSTPSNSFTPRTKVSFGSSARNVGNLSASCADFYSSQLTATTARNETLVPKTKRSLQNAAVKKKAKDTLNAARRGSARGRGRGGKGGQSGAVARASTWEMVYTHIGLPGEHRHKRSNPPYVEPTVASQASGIANVPLAQPGLPRENTTSERKRESAASSPPIKSPGNNALYSEDDSSVSSSPCSHSPMNQEELLNLFVDSNFSATSILKQLAESRVKEDEKNTDDNESSNKKSELDNVWSNWHSDSSKISPSTSCPEDKSKTDTTANGPSLSHFTMSSSLSTTSTTFSDTCNTAPTKRPSSLIGKTDSKLDSATGSKLLEKAPKRQRRSFAELEVKREMLDLSNKLFKQELEKSSQVPSAVSSTSQVSNQSQDIVSPTTATTTTSSSTSISLQTAALRNYNQYGYYYSAEDLKALGSKSLSLKSVSKPGLSTKVAKSENAPQLEPNLNTYLSANNNLNPTSTIVSQHSQEVACDDNSMQQQDLISSSSISVKQDANTLPLQQVAKDETKDQMESKTENDTENMKTAVSNPSILGDCVSSNSDSIQTASPTSQPSSTFIDSKESTITVPPTSSSLLTPSSCNDTKPSEHMPSDSKSYKRGGQCYALSYVYPMGTVWYPYVAITPNAVLGNNQKNGSESNDEDQAKASNALNNFSSTQYIDLASSLRYWQQLSLLYKNKLFASTTCIPNVLTSSDKSESISSLPNAITCTSASTLLEGSSCSSPGNSNNKPPRRASVIVTAKDMETYNNEFNNSVGISNRVLSSTPESTTSSESNTSDGIKSEVSLVIDNSDRLIEEQCHRMSQVFATTSEDISPNSTKTLSNDAPAIPSLSFIPDSSIAYVNIGNNTGTKKSGSNGKDSKVKSKRRKSTKSI